MLKSDVTYKHGIGTLGGRRMSYAKFAVQHIREILRRKKNSTTYSLDRVMPGEKGRQESAGAGLSYDDFGPPEQAEWNELLDYISGPELSAIESLSIRAYYLERQPIKAIADSFKVTRQSIYLAIARGLEKVKKKYGEENG